MTQREWFLALRPLLPALGGTVAAGALIGLGLGREALGRMTWLFPAVVFVAAALCAPSLVLGAGLLGRPLAPATALPAMLGGLGSTGHALLGFLPVGLFVTTTSADRGTALVSVMPLVAVALTVGLLRLWDLLGEPWKRQPRLVLLFLGWSGLVMATGFLLLVHCLRGVA